ncbi:PAS domain-containing protein [Sediminibacterium sp.]|uniref:PAS domain-containing protein n=1 Tax=Sediminibacterium sp. TaxID=1917865 RepID=UPI003F7245B6
MQYNFEINDALTHNNEMIDQFLLATDLDGNIIYCNDSFQRLYKLLGVPVSGLSIESILNSKEAGLYRKSLIQCKQNSNSVEKLTFKKPGSDCVDEYMHFTMLPNLDKKGKIIGVILKGVSSNAKPSVEKYTKQVSMVNSTLVNPGICFETMADFMPEIMWLTDKQHQIIQVNQAWINFCGTSREEELGNRWMKRIHPEDIERFIEEQKHLFATQSAYAITFRFKRYDGSFRWVNMKGNPIYSETGEFLGYTGITLDITPVKEAQIQIRRQQELMESTKIEFGKFTKIAQKIGSIIIMCNADNRITWVNDAFVKTTGYSLKEASGKTPGSFLKGPETSKETLKRIKKVIEQGKGIRTEILYYTKNGSKVWLDIMIESLFDQDGTITGYITIQKDITLKKISEKEVMEQMNYLKKISFITSHELRHEFSKILQLLQTAKFQDHNVATYSQIFSDIEHSANLMNDTIFKLNDQINFASSSSISLNKYLLNQAIEEIILVDDDHLVNKLNELIIRNVMPSMPVHTFDHVDNALQYVKDNPNTKRKIFLDLNFSGRSGWDFLHEYEKLGHVWPVVILTSSIDHIDYERSKKFLNVTHFITKPLTIEQFEKLSEMEHMMVH